MSLRGWREERGAVAVEFALVLPVLILILFGIIEFGSMFNAQLLVTGAAREAARSISVGGTPTAATAAAVVSSPGLTPALLTPAYSYSSGSSCAAGGSVTVTIDYPKAFVTGFFGTPITLHGVATRQCGG